MLDIREASEKDAKEIEELLRQLIDNEKISVLPERLQEVKRSSNSFVYVAVSDERIVATAQMSLCPDIMFQRQPYAVVENIVVDESVRNSGAGRALMDIIENKCLESDCSKIMLLSSSSRSVAHQFFQSTGFSGDLKKGFVKYRKSFKINNIV